MENKEKITSNIPASEEESMELFQKIELYIEKYNLLPPLSLEELRELAETFIRENNFSETILDWVIVMINNCLWKDTIASIPFESRLLLLPQCLRHSKQCKADFDEFGLLCAKCGICSIYKLQEEAEKLGMLTLVAEGSTAIAGLIENSKIDAVIGVSCLEALEKAFPLMVNHAIPGIAIPLYKSGCENTSVCHKLVQNALNLSSEKVMKSFDPDTIKKRVREWFSPSVLVETLGEPCASVEKIAQEYLAGPGKRWRPFLLAAVYTALTGEKEYPLLIREIAVAVECFHKASLIHDDIEDNDHYRSDKKTLHYNLGIPIALNVGDLLIGEGYRILTIADTDEKMKTELLKVAVKAHHDLCVGQGAELEWIKNPKEITLSNMIKIYTLKTAPAFSAALNFGAICARANHELQTVLNNFSEALGVAYQLLDDLEDYHTIFDKSNSMIQPSSVLAAACEIYKDNLISRLISSDTHKETISKLNKEKIIDRSKTKVKLLYEHYRKQTFRCLHQLYIPDLKRLLFSITGKILKDV